MSRAPACPQCGSKRVWKDGIRRLIDGSVVQRWLCRDCGYRFSDPSKTSKRKNLHSFYCRVGGWEGQPKNSAKAVEALRELEEAEKRVAGATETSQVDVKGKIVEFLWWMKKQGYSKHTIFSRGKKLQRLVRLGANLLDPESVKETIAKQEKWSESHKEAVVCAYDLFVRWLGLEWDKPRYRKVQKLPFIPLEREIDDLIAGCSKQISTFLQIAKETGARAGEIFQLRWDDVDFERRTIRIAPEKGSNPRIFRISGKLLGMLVKLPRRDERIFSHYKNLNSLTRTFQRQRKRIAHKVANPRLLKISFHTLRHWKATMEYAKTRDILHVMKMLGHKSIKNTLIYTQLVKGTEEDEFICKIARTPKEISQLIELGFEYVCEQDGLKFFRKRK